MRSPELSDEMLAGLRETLADWDYRATVAFTHLFMEAGDEDANAGFDQLALAHPLAEQLLAERYLSPSPDLECLLPAFKKANSEAGTSMEGPATTSSPATTRPRWVRSGW